MKFRTLCILVFCAIVGPIYAQGSKDSIEFHTNIKKLGSAGDSTLYFLQQAESYAYSPLVVAKLNLEWAWYHIDRNHMDSAEMRIRMGIDAGKSFESREYKGILARNYATLRTVYVRTGDYQDAIDAQFEAIEILESDSIDNYTLTAIYKNVAIDYWRMQNYAESEKWLKVGLKASRRYGYSTLEMQCYLTLGLVYEGINKLTEAKNHYRYVFQLIGNDIEKHGRDYFATCNNIGEVFKAEGQADSSIFYYKRGLEIISNDQISPLYNHLIPYYKALITHNISDHYLIEGNLEKALLYSKNAVQIKEDLFGMEHPELISPYLGLGDVYYKLLEYDKGLDYMTRALTIAKTSNLKISNCYNFLGDLFKSKGNDFRAIQYYDSAILSNPSVLIDGMRMYSNPVQILYSYYGLSKLRIAEKPLNTDQIEQLYLQAKELIRFLYSKTNDTQQHKYLTGSLENFYLAFSDEYQESNEQKWMDYMWEIMELNKAMKLRIQLKSEYSLSYSIPDAILAEEKALKDSINDHISDLKPGIFDSTLFKLNVRHNNLISRLESDYPKYHELKYNIDIRSLASTRSSLTERQVILNFFEGNESLYMIKIFKGQIFNVKIPKDEMYDWIRLFNIAVSNGNEKELLRISSQIARQLLFSEQSISPKQPIIIIPDGIIWKMNFAALARKEGERIIFLGNESTLSYQYFATEFNEDSKSKKGVIAFAYNAPSPTGNNYEKQPEELARDFDESLPGTYDEVNEISKIWLGKYYYAEQANETTFKEVSKDYNIIHLAIHGEMDEIYPENSFLKFSSADSLNDGLLHSYELYNLDFNAELAVLSACYSGTGKLVNGEGLMSLGRSFAYAGVRSLLVSRWQVSDVSAPFIIQYFYKGLKKGMLKSEALKYAQNEFLKNDADNITSSPVYWAGFYIIGDDSPVSNPGDRRSWLFGIITVVIIFTFIIIQGRRSSNRIQKQL